VFDLSIGKLLVLGVIALVIFGPDQLPKMASQLGRTLRDLRRMADGATRDLREGLGPEFSEFDVRDLHPGNFVRKHLLDGLDGDYDGATPGTAESESEGEYMAGRTATATLAREETPPFDPEAT
jgi:sec-independent protein translocase protein TatB